MIEVKTRLNKKELKDAYAKIASCKKLSKTPKTSMDQKATGSDLTTVGTLGIVFGFDTDISLEALANEAKDLNKSYESRLWPNMIAVLDKGVINYALSFPGEENLSGELAPPCDENFKVPPFYIHLAILEDKEYTLNRFFTSLLSHLTFYPHRPSMVPFNVMMEGAPNTAMTITSYQYNTKRQLVTTPSSLYQENNPRPLLSMKISDKAGKQIGLLQYMPWQDGAVLRWFGQVPLEVILSFLIPDFDGFIIVTNKPNCQLTSVFKLTEEQFKTWPNVLSKNDDLEAILE